MKYYRRLLEKTSGTGIIMKQDIVVMLFPLLVRDNYVTAFRVLIREIVDSKRTDPRKLEQLSSILMLGIKYHLLDSSFIKSEQICTAYCGELDSIRQTMEEACTVVQTNRVQTKRYSIISNSIRYDSHRSISCESMAHYLVSRLESYLSAIKHTEFLDAILDEGRNPSRYPNFTGMSVYTNDVSRFVRNCRDTKYFMGVIKVLITMKNYHIIAAIIAGFDEIPKKYSLQINHLSTIVMSPTHDVFVSRIGGKSKSTGSVPFLGMLITDIKHAIDEMLLHCKENRDSTVHRIEKNQWNTLHYIYKLVQLFRTITNTSNSLIDHSIDQYFNRVLDDLYIYSRKIYEWTVTDVCHFIRNVLITDSMLYDIDSIITRIEQHQIDGKILERMTVDDFISIGLISKIANRIVSRVDAYCETADYNYMDSVHDLCILLRNNRLDRYCKTFAHHQILPSMIQYLLDEDLHYMEVETADIERIREILT